MSKQTINIGASPNDGTGTPLRTSFDYTNQNFTELYTAVGPSGNNIVVPGNATITGDLTVDTSTLKVDSTNNRVGVVQATPLYPLHLVGEFGLQEESAGNGSKLRFIGDATKYNFRLGKQLTSTNTFEITPSTAVGGTTFSNPVYTVSYDGIHTFLDGAGGTRMTLNSTGLGIGVVPSSYRLRILAPFASGINGAYIETGDYNVKTLVVNNTNPALAENLFEVQKVGTALLTLDASGNLLVGTTVAGMTAGGLSQRNFNGNCGQILFSNNSGAAEYVARFYYGSTPTNVGNITVASSGTTYDTISDYRLKESVKPISGGLTRVNALKPSVYNWKSDGSTGEGFLAHELAEVVPFAVIGEKDAVNEDGTIKSQGIDMSRIVPILVAAIQELTARVQTLEAR